MSKLTPRQQQIARLLATGKTQRQIAHELGVAQQTIYNTTAAMRARTNEPSTFSIAIKAATLSK